MTALSGIEPNAAAAYLYGKLNGVSEIVAAGPGGVFRYEAVDADGQTIDPGEAYWVYQNQDAGGIDYQAVGAIPVTVTMLWAVKLVIPGMSVSATQRTGLAKAFELLNGGTGTAYGLAIHSRRTGPLEYPEEDGNLRFLHIGGIYQLTVTGG